MPTPRVFLPAIISGPLLWAAFFPLDLGPLAAVALAPFLTLVRADGVSRKRRYFAAYLGGLAFYLPALQWLRHAHPMMYLSWIGLALACSLFHVAAIFLLRRLDRLGQPSLALTVPLVWVTLEYIRAHFPTGYPFLKPLGMHQPVGFGWYFLGHPMHSYPLVIQLADVAGVYGISAVLAAINGATTEWLERHTFVRRLLRRPAVYRIGFYREMWGTAGAGTLFAATIAYGTSRVQHPEYEKGPRIAAIQADIAQDDKMTNLKPLFDKYSELTFTAAARADLVVWPETCNPYPLNELVPGTDPATINPEYLDLGKDNREALATYGKAWKTNVLVGLIVNVADADGKKKYNAAVLTGPDGVGEKFYAKMHLVPFGEYVPFKRTMPWLQAFTPYSHDHSCTPGEEYTRFRISVADRPFTFGVLICYEDSDPYLARQYVRPGTEKVDFLLNISNDGWFRGSEEHEQHLAICRFRAVETRRSVVRAVNMGISAIIDPDGKVVALPGDSWAQSKRMTGTVTDRVPLGTTDSLYAAWGDWLPAVCAFGLFAGLVASRWRTVKTTAAVGQSG